MKSKILIIEDEKKIARFVELELSYVGIHYFALPTFLKTTDGKEQEAPGLGVGYLLLRFLISSALKIIWINPTLPFSPA